MIESIQIGGVATYGCIPESLTELSKINFLFGSNGSGKTTLTRVIANEGDYPTCNITWKGGTKLQVMVYNHDFVANNFSQSADLKGIFTLGAKNVEVLERLAAAKVEHDHITERIEALNLALGGGTGGKERELNEVEEQFKEKCWAIFAKHKRKLAQAFEGAKKSKEAFKDRVLRERGPISALPPAPLADLEKRAETIFGPAPSIEKSLPILDAAKVVGHESDAILKKLVVGREDVDIGAMIRKLGSSDWVRRGRDFYDGGHSVCPFCQQVTTAAFAKSLNEYFDETFESDSRAIDALIFNYTNDSAEICRQISFLITTSSKFLDIENLAAELALLESKISINAQRLSAKKKEPSQVVELVSINSTVSTIRGLIDAANEQIASHNKTVANLAQERVELTASVWKYLVDVELKADLAEYDKKRSALRDAIAGIKEAIGVASADKQAKVVELRKLEKETTSIQPTIDGINALLASFGFRSFSLVQATKGTNYKLVRQDGADAKTTLSEGEKSFVSFLYFYYLLKGSESETGMTADRIVVIDDPVSSLDSDVLFIVGSLIKDIFCEIRSGNGNIKQAFVLTHNVYFHKEVTFNNRRGRLNRLNDETFWVVRKPELLTLLEHHKSNPIRTSYELLWSEIRRPERSSVTIPNALRRILENYFKILGGVDFRQICSKFDGSERLICNSLFSWVHDGSHFSNEDLYVSIPDSRVDVYMNVFRDIFRKLGHIEHYKMMMGESYADEAIASAPD